MAAGAATLSALKQPGTYEELERRGALLERILRAALDQAEIRAQINRAGSMLTVFYCDQPVTDFATAATADTERYARLHARLLASGVFFAPSQFEAAFVSLAHSDDDIERTGAAFEEALRQE
jgi:glutamate-1-semialdehyde 2,1-aminomutase